MTSEPMDNKVLWLLRREDMVVLELLFKNLSRVVDSSGAATLVVTDPGQPAQLIVDFPPQAVREEVFDSSTAAPTLQMVCNARFSGLCRLTFQIPPNGPSLVFTTAGLLAWIGLPTVDAPLECVWGLSFSPAFRPNDVWLHAQQPGTSTGGVTGLWHTSLMVRDSTGMPNFTNRDPMPMVAVFTGVALPNPDFPAPMGVDDLQRINDVSATSPLGARELILSAAGSTIEVSGHWPPATAADVLTAYKHRAVLGRDVSVTTERRGYLLPFGFPAKLLQVTERVGNPFSSFGSAALVKTQTLSVSDPSIHYEGLPGLPAAGRHFPFRSVRLHDPLTAQVNTQDNSVTTGVTWVNVVGDSSPGGRYPFHMSAEDYAGNIVSFDAACYFVDQDNALQASGGSLGAGAGAYETEQHLVGRPAAGKVALAIGAPDSMVDITAMYFGCLLPENDSAAKALADAGHLVAFPRLAGVDARIPAIDALNRPQTGAAPSALAAGVAGPLGPELELATTYLKSGLPASGVYAQLSQPKAFLPPATAAGGLAGLNVPVVGLSTVSGLLGGAAKGQLDALEGQFDPQKFFPTAAAAQQIAGYLPPTLLGFINLADIVAPANVGDGERVPQIKTELIYGSGPASASPPLPAPPPVPAPPRLPSAVRSSVTWRPLIKSVAAGVLHTRTDTTLELRSVTTIDLRGGKPISDVRGELRSFDLVFLDGLVTVTFDRLAFSWHAGGTPSLDVKIGKVQPGPGALQFFQQLLAQLPDTSNGPHIDFRDNSLVAGYTLALPSLPMGAFLMQNLAISSSVSVPLDGRAVEASFKFASREQPFLVTVSVFGGGGFLAVRVAGDDIKELEAQIDFGAATSLDLVVASASVAVTASIHLRLTDAKALTIDGFFRAKGQVQVLGIISVSVEIYLGLHYESGPPERFAGTAMFTVRVRVLFYSQSLTFSVTRSFAAGSDPTFAVAFPSPQIWQQHCAAFAPMVAQ